MPTYKENFLEKIEVRKGLRTTAAIPLIVDDWTLAFHLGFTGKTTWYFVEQRDKMYKQFMLKKKTGGLRRTFDPNPIIRVFQMQMRAKILLPLCATLGPHVSAYQIGKSTVNAATMHLRPCVVCDETTKPGTNPGKHQCPRRGVKFKLDLKDFFLSTSRAMIRNYFHDIVGYNFYASALLGQLLTTDYLDDRGKRRTGVPPGALTAGDICNLVADRLIDGPMAKALPEWTYTRYADDLYFSHDKQLTSKQVGHAIQVAAGVIRESGYRVNWKKTQIQYWSGPQRILGININRKLNIPAHEYRKMHMLLYKANKKGFEEQLKWSKVETVPELHAMIVGKLNYFSQFAPHKAAKLHRLYATAKATHHSSEITMFEFVNGELQSEPVELDIVHPLKESA